MLFGNLLESSAQQGQDIQLQNLSKELNDAIVRAKSLANNCKIGHYEQSEFKTTPTGDLIIPEYKQHINYNEQFWKKYLKNQINFAIIRDLSEKMVDLQVQVKQVENLNEEYTKLYKIKNRKKNRRLAVEIQKKYQCPYERCYRVYGSDVSLNLHIKLKHGGGNKTDRQKLAEQICQAEEKGQPLPEMRFNLPLGYLQQYRKGYHERGSQQKQNWLSMGPS